MIRNIKIENYKSIKNLDIDLKNINILIGSNGAGKSNFVSFFKLLNSLIRKNIQNHIAKESGAKNILYYGLKESKYLCGEITFQNDDAYSFKLVPNTEEGLYFESEALDYKNYNIPLNKISNGNSETRIEMFEKKNLFGEDIDDTEEITELMKKFKVHHFHDTSKTALVKQSFNIHDNEILYEDARNLASFLFKLSIKEPKALKKIEKTIRLIAPYFDGFILKPNVYDDEEIRLAWKEKNSDMLFNASHLSDGTLRMICLVTLFLQPNPPKIIILDEPELGLHPFALTVLSDLIKKVSAKKTQVIISTQSVPLIDKFDIEDIVIVEKKSKESTFKRLKIDELKEWVDEYSVGELWEKNLLGGRP